MGGNSKLNLPFFFKGNYMVFFPISNKKIRNKISYTEDAIANCYMRNYTLCSKHSFVCKCSKHLWLSNQPLSLKHFKITNTNENLHVWRKLINKRYDLKTHEQTRMNMNTNFVEGFNRL